MPKYQFGDGINSARINVNVKMKSDKARSTRQMYDGSRNRRRLSGWNPTRASINVLLSQGGEVLRNRARDLIRNNPYASGALDSWVANAVGTGIVPSPLLDDPDMKAQVKVLWNDWTDECDADGLCDFYGLQACVGREIYEAGECFIRLRSRLPSDNLSVPFQLQLLESEMLDFNYNSILENGNTIMNGVEFDLIDRRVAYHFWRNHPGDMTLGLDYRMIDRVRVPASEVIHVFKPVRAGQVRGVPIIAPAMVKLWVLDQYDDAELDRKKIAAMFGGFVETPAAESDELFGEDEVAEGVGDDAGKGILTLEPGTIQTLLPGEQIKFAEPADVGGSYEMFQYRNLLSVYSALGVPYVLGTWDLKRANYSSLRGALVEYRRRLEQVQHQVLVFQACRAVYNRFMDLGVLSGALDIPNYNAQRRKMLKAKWIPPKFDWVDPLKDITAELLAVRAGFKSLDDAIEQTGEDASDVVARIAAMNDALDKAGLVLDSDPRMVSRAGLTQARPAGSVVPDPNSTDVQDAIDNAGGIDNTDLAA